MERSKNQDLHSSSDYVALDEGTTSCKDNDTHAQPQFNQTKSVLFALISGIWYGLQNFILGDKAGLGFIAAFSINIGNLAYAVGFCIFYMALQIYRRDTIWEWATSNFRHPKGGLHRYNIIWLVLYIISALLAAIFVVFCFKFSLDAELNQGIMASLFGLTPLSSALMAYIIFRETLKKSHFIGMVFMLICIIGIGFGSATRETNQIHSATSTLSQFVYSLLGIVFGILWPIIFSAGGMIIRFANEGEKQGKNMPNLKGYNSTDLTIASYFGINIVAIVGSIILYKTGDHPFILSEYLQIALAGFIAAIGVVWMNYALTIGYAGPVFALANLEVIIQAILDVVILGQVPNLIEILAACFGLVGACILALMG